MSNFREAEMPFPWIPIFIVFCTLVLAVFVARWFFQYATYLWAERDHSSKKKKKKKTRGRSSRRKKAKYSDSSSESSSSSEDSSE